VASSEKVLGHHNLTRAQDIGTVQYSLPYCLATTAYRNPSDPNSFLNNPHEDPKIADLAQRVRSSLNEESLLPGKAWATRMKVVVRDGRTVEAARNDFAARRAIR
jgi:2-methylcitrate dehydratase PrpD